jgi:signal transduction histidine kinase
MKKRKFPRFSFTRRLSMLVMLVIYVFVILFVSIAISGSILFLLVRSGVLPPFSESRVPMFLFYLMLVSLFVGTILAIVGGGWLLRSQRKLIEATREVASGNFNFRIEEDGPHEIARIAKSFNDMAKELSSIETLRSDFINNISHEFKTPIVSIKGFAKRLKKGTLSEQQRNEYIDIIISESERLTRLSSNVLLLSRLENTEQDMEKGLYALDEQIRRAILLLEPQLQKKQLEVDARIDSVQIHAGEEMLSHLWLNLLGNAIKFSPDGGTVGISLTQIGDEAVVTVSDMGAGMDEEMQRHIFVKFYQGDSSRATEGNGLGLSLVKRILELENGKITVDSETGKGTRFTVTLPMQ